MPTKKEQNQIEKSAREYQRKAAYEAVKRKRNPDGSLKKEFEKGFNN
jgi:hypothetical protein